MQNTLPVTNENGYFEIRLESIGGMGANLCGKMLGELGALYLSLNASSFSSYGSEKRGSPVKAFVRWCREDMPIRVNSPVVSPHILCIFHEGLMGRLPVLDGVKPDTKIILNTPLSPDEAMQKYGFAKGTLYCIDALKNCHGIPLPHQYGAAWRHCKGIRICSPRLCKKPVQGHHREKIS